MIIASVLVLGISIFIHELGHLLCGKLVGVEARIFSIGYGKGIWKKRIGGTTYQITNIPIGGYVMFKGDRYGSRLKGKKGELLSTPPFKRMIPVLGGPFFNLLLGFFLFFLLALLGDTPPGNKIFIDPSLEDITPAFHAGLRSGDKILKINGSTTSSFEEIFAKIGLSKGEDIEIEYERDSQIYKTIVSPEIHSEGGRPSIGVSPYGKRTIVANFSYSEQFRHWVKTLLGDPREFDKDNLSKSNSSLNRKFANLQNRAIHFLNDGDEFLTVEDKPVSTIGELQKILAQHQDETVFIKVLRKKHPLLTPWSKEEVTVSVPVVGSDILELKNIVDPKLESIKIGTYNLIAHDPDIDTKLANISINGKKFKNFGELKKTLQSISEKKIRIDILGLEFESEFELKPIGLLGFKPSLKFEQEKPETTISVVDALQIAGMKIYQNVAMSLTALKLMLTGFISPSDNLAGPVGIVHFAGVSIEYGFLTYLDFIARISIALMIMNLLPIPVADGGHIVMYFYEAIAGRPMPQNVMETIFKIGFLFLLFLAIFVTFNEVMNIFK
jgi:regulator of sigma E protease